MEGQIAVEQFRQLKDWPGAWTKQRHLIVAYAILGCIALALEQYTEAASFVETCVAGYRSLQRPQDVSMALCILSYALWAQGRIAEAGVHLTEALRLGVEIGDHMALVYGLVGMALILVSHKTYARAVELIAAVSANFPLLEVSRWFWDVALRHIDAVKATLSPDVVAAAQERGQARELRETAAEMLAELEAMARAV